MTAPRLAAAMAGLLLLSAGARAADGFDRPYLPDLLRLSELAGAVGYLDELCGGEAGAWRRRMLALVDAAAPTVAARRPLAEAFNRGQRTAAAIHRSCTAQARSILARDLAEGATLAGGIADRYGGEPSSPRPPAAAAPSPPLR